MDLLKDSIPLEDHAPSSVGLSVAEVGQLPPGTKLKVLRAGYRVEGSPDVGDVVTTLYHPYVPLYAADRHGEVWSWLKENTRWRFEVVP